MKLKSFLLEKRDVIEGTNCGNCMYTQKSVSEKVEKEDLNSQGGIDSKAKKDLKLAEKADLITLPGDMLTDTKKHCNHPMVDQFVTSRMCCAYWDSEGTHRAYGDQKIGR